MVRNKPSGNPARRGAYVRIKATGETHFVWVAGGDDLLTVCGRFLDRHARWNGTETYDSPLEIPDEPGAAFCPECQRLGKDGGPA